MKTSKKFAAKKTEESKKQLIDRLITKASLDFKCCGNGRCTAEIKTK